MSKILIECKAVANNSGFSIMSPLIGRVRFLITNGNVVVPGQIIGEVMRLNQRFLLKLPEGVFGKIVSLKSCDCSIAIEYAEPLLEIEPMHMGEVALPKLQQESKNASVEAPMDGMFYLSPSPKDPPYVKVGDIISPGQTIGLIEVMKCFYPLKYQGAEKVKIIDIKVGSASPVSSGTKIMIVQ